MTGTSLDAVDMAVLETDGHGIAGFGPAGEVKLDSQARALIEAATREARSWPMGAPPPPAFAAAARAVAQEHLRAARAFMAEHGLTAADLDLVGVHGQTILHEPPGPARRVGRTVQLIEAELLAQALDLPIAYDFRTADVAAGGQGAPLAPVYHAALARWSNLEPPVAVLNLGGVGNITLIAPDGDLHAFDTGPANGMIDLLVQARTGARCDIDGALARAGRVNAAVLRDYLAHEHFQTAGPKSLDRHDFSLEPVANLALEDAAATLTAFAAEAVAAGVRSLAHRPSRLVVCGGGRLNPTLMAQIAARTDAPVCTAEDMGWRGDAIEAEAFAYLAARCVEGLPISYPGVTGVSAAMSGGRVIGLA